MQLNSTFLFFQLSETTTQNLEFSLPRLLLTLEFNVVVVTRIYFNLN